MPDPNQGPKPRVLLVHILLWFVFSFVFAAVCVAQQNNVADDTFSPPELGDGWQVADVSFAGLDKKAMQALTDEIIAGDFLNIHSVLIAHQDHLIYEYYFTRPGRDVTKMRQLGREEAHVLNSITKSVTSLLLGIALESDYQTALTSPLYDYFPKYSHPDPQVKDITLEHALTMTAGLLWNEMDVSYPDPYNDDNRLQRSIDPMDYLLSRPVREPPGTYWYYNGGLTMAVAAVIDTLIEKPLLEFANDVLFKPLHIKKYFWTGAWPGNRLVNAAWGLRLRARDLAKIGMMVLNRGSWHDKSVISSEWIDLSTRRIREDLRSWSADGLYGYGYQWWYGEHDDPDLKFNAITGLGYGGQRLFILPEQELVVTVFAANYGDDWLKPEAILKRIVAAIE